MSTTTMAGIQKPFVSRLFESVQRRSSMLLDKSTPHVAIRWGVFGLLTFIYAIRVYFLQGFYIVTYGLGIYLLNLFIGFLQPQDEMGINETQKDGPTLPVSGDEHLPEYRPFRRRVGEFKFWFSASKAVVISFFMTFFSIFDIPVFWPILLLYFIVLFALTMKRQIQHMFQHRYVPFSFGKPKFDKKIVKKKQPVAPMPKVRPPIRAMPMPQGLKKVNKD